MSLQMLVQQKFWCNCGFVSFFLSRSLALSLSLLLLLFLPFSCHAVQVLTNAQNEWQLPLPVRGCRLSQRKITCLAQKFCLFIILTSSRAEAASRHELRFAIFLCLPHPLLTPCKVWNEAGKKLLGSHMLPVAVCQGVPKNYTLHFNHNSNQRNHRHYSHSRSRRSTRSIRQHFSACAKWKNATWAKLLPRKRSTCSQCCCCSSLTCQAAVGDNANVMGNKVPRVVEYSQYFIATAGRGLKREK